MAASQTRRSRAHRKSGRYRDVAAASATRVPAAPAGIAYCLVATKAAGFDWMVPIAMVIAYTPASKVDQRLELREALQAVAATIARDRGRHPAGSAGASAGAAIGILAILARWAKQEWSRTGTDSNTSQNSCMVR